MIFQLFYVSRASEGIEVSDVRNILTVSQGNNKHYDLTGCLLFSGRHFAQVLEGAGDDVSALVYKLSSDRRHTDMRILFGHHVMVRQFPQWPMACLHNPDAETRIEHLLNPENQVSPTSDLLALMTGIRFDALMTTL